ncbi:MAG: DNA polymerase III subunit gamma/tau [Candidatus Binatia bacterium]
MGYEVVARRWRPTTFSEVIGQGHITETLAHAIERDRVAHAFLFTGTRGVGKTTVARLLARSLNCQHRKGAEPCNSCANCVQNIAGSSVDVIEIDGASNNSVDDVRSLIEASRYRPASSAYRVYIIDEVHQLSQSAFNALLKLLEEPPEHVKFIMATTELHKMPATVLSRCQRYDFRRISLDEISRCLQRVIEGDGLKVEADAIALLAREADGSMRDAQSLLEQVVASGSDRIDAAFVSEFLGIADRDTVAGIVEALLEGDAARIVEFVANVRTGGYDPAHLLQRVMELLRCVTIAASASESVLPAGVGQDYRDLAARLRSKRSTLDLHRMFQCLLVTAQQLRGVDYADLVLEMGLLKVASLEPVAMAAEVLERLRGGGETSATEATGAGAGRTLAKRDTAAKTRAERPVVEGGAVENPAETRRGPEEWEAFLAGVQKKAGIDLYVTLSNCEVVELNEKRLALKPALAGFKAKLAGRQVRGRVVDLVAEHFGPDVKLELVGEGASGASEGFSVHSLERDRDQAAHGDARADPLVRAALDILGGNIERIDRLRSDD